MRLDMRNAFAPIWSPMGTRVLIAARSRYRVSDGGASGSVLSASPARTFFRGRGRKKVRTDPARGFSPPSLTYYVGSHRILATALSASGLGLARRSGVNLSARSGTPQFHRAMINLTGNSSYVRRLLPIEGKGKIGRAESLCGHHGSGGL